MLSRSKLSLFAGATAALSLAAGVTAAWAWGATGHRLIGRVAIESLPADLPAFLRSPKAVEAIGEIAREPDRSKGAGQPHDADYDTSHFVDLTEDGHVFSEAGPLIGNMPRSRHDYDVALAKAGIDPFKGGHLYYAMLETYQQLVKDFAYWRIETHILRRNLVPAHRDWIERDIARREDLLFRDLGFLAHYTGDGSQPFHTSIHYNGWGDYPNPEGFTAEKIHGPFEGEFIAANITEADVKRALPAPADCGPNVQACVTGYLLKDKDKVIPLFRLWKTGGFQTNSPEAKAFALERVAAGAGMLRDLVTRAWADSGRQGMGYKPMVTASEVERGQVSDAKVLWDDLYGDD